MSVATWPRSALLLVLCGFSHPALAADATRPHGSSPPVTNGRHVGAAWDARSVSDDERWPCDREPSSRRWAAIRPRVDWTFSAQPATVSRKGWITIRTTFRNRSATPATIRLPFRPDEGMEVIVRDAQGRTVWRFFEGSEPDLMTTELQLAPQTIRVFRQRWNGRGADGNRLPAGRYTLIVARQIDPPPDSLVSGPSPCQLMLR